MALRTLADFINEDVDILSVGLNPSPNSVRDGYPFATPQNRFWRALNASQLVVRCYPPGVESMHRLLIDEHIGFTDVVKRPTPGASGLCARDYRQWAPILRDKIEQFRPRIVWFQGKMAYQNYLRYGLGRNASNVEWGAQEAPCGSAAVFVTPNPSAANAAYSLEQITRWFDHLAELARSKLVGLNERVL